MSSPKACARGMGRGRRGFTIVEIMVAVVIIGLLAALALPAFNRVRDRPRAARLINDFRQFEAAFQHYATETGQWPAAGGVGAIPIEMVNALPAAFASPSPLGGNFQWSGPSRYVVLRGSQATDTMMLLVDASLDDGNLATGEFVKIAGVGYGYHAH